MKMETLSAKDPRRCQHGMGPKTLKGCCMPPQNLEAALEATVALAWEAADVALAHYRPGITVDTKGGDPGNLVTQADRDVNTLLVERLQRAYPDDAILAEESITSHDFKSRQHCRRLWCIDPIDGTREFVERSGQFAVMIGLAIDGAARLGVVLQPTEARVYAGCLLGDGRALAWTADREGFKQPLRVGTIDRPDDARLMVSRTFRSRGITLLAQRLGVKQMQPLGSVGLKMARLARGEADLYVSLSSQTHEWDACGPEAILRAAGGTVTDLDGLPLRYNKELTPTPRGIVASNGALHGGCLEALRAIEEQRRKGLPRP